MRINKNGDQSSRVCSVIVPDLFADRGQLDAMVLETTFIGIVAGDGRRLAIALGDQAVDGNSRSHCGACQDGSAKKPGGRGALCNGGGIIGSAGPAALPAHCNAWRVAACAVDSYRRTACPMPGYCRAGRASSLRQSRDFSAWG